MFCRKLDCGTYIVEEYCNTAYQSNNGHPVNLNVQEKSLFLLTHRKQNSTVLGGHTHNAIMQLVVSSSDVNPAYILYDASQRELDWNPTRQSNKV